MNINSSRFSNELLSNMNQIIQDIIEITEIPSPSFFEEKRIEFIKKYVENISGLTIEEDKQKNIIIRYPGQTSTAKICVLAHLDTVFPENTVLTVKRDPVYLSGPGIGDNSTSVAVMLNIIKTWKKLNYIPPFDVLFVGNSCEEGLGDLKGTKFFIQNYCTTSHDVDLKVFLALDGTVTWVSHAGICVKRLKVIMKGDGGHSWGDFPKPSAIHVLAKVIAKISEIKVPKRPKTTFNIGLVSGGTSINTIASDASCFIDLRSENTSELNRLETKVRKIISENSKKGISSQIEIVGDRPSGHINSDHPIVQILMAIGNKYGIQPHSSASSTDANIPLSKGIPAMAFGCYQGSGAHTLNEKIEIESLKIGIPFANSVILSVIEYVEHHM